MTTPHSNPRKRNTKGEYAARNAKHLKATGQTYNQARGAKERAIVKPTQSTAKSLQAAFDHFNRTLFGSTLPQCMVTLRTFGKARGYFSPDRFVNLTEVSTVHEIALDPRQFVDRSEVETLSTLVHEMCHLWQAAHGSMSRAGYHNAEWGTEMKRIGLHPSDTAAPGGKETGQRMSHYIVEGGPFALAAAKLVASGRAPLAWSDIEGFLTASPSAVPAPLAGALAGRTAKVSTKAGKRTKFVCPACQGAVWGKESILVACAGTTDAQHPPIQMLS